MSRYVKLNVGGSLFQTTLDTLCKYDSMLRAMFSGRMEVLRDSDGYVLIDRSGKHFGTILNFLRDGTVPLPECKTEVQELLAEAKYYCLQELVALCQSWLDFVNVSHNSEVGLSNFCRVPVVCNRKDVEAIFNVCTDKPIIKLLVNRNNNKYSYTSQSDDNFLKNMELFDRLVPRFHGRVLFVKDIGLDSAEICQWTFYARSKRKAELCCTSIVYATDRKQTKVEFPEARIYEEAMNALLLFDKQIANICPQCGSCNENGSEQDIDTALMSHLHVPVSRSNSNSPWMSTSPTPTNSNAPPVQVISTPSERLIVRFVRPPNTLGNPTVVRSDPDSQHGGETSRDAYHDRDRDRNQQQPHYNDSPTNSNCDD
uniref:BTB domain-containing protein n=1 Tax=Acrobeloides nanus TaxID=290746 RepID=A0A914E0P4_9BILA